MLAGWIVHFIGVFVGDVASTIGSGNIAQGALQGYSVDEVQGILPALQANSSEMLAMHAIFSR